MKLKSLKIVLQNLFLRLILLLILSSCTKIDTDKVEAFDQSIRFTDYLKTANIHDSNEFKTLSNDNNVSFLNKYGFDTWSTVGKTGVNRLLAPSVMVSNDSVLFSLIVKFDDKGKGIDISTVALISNELNEMIKVPLNRADDQEYIGLMGFFQNREMVDRFKAIINREEVRMSFLDGVDHIYFGLSRDDKKMLNKTVDLFYELTELKIKYYNNIKLPTVETKQNTSEIRKLKNSEAYNIYGDFEAYFPTEPQVNESEYLKKKNILHCSAEDGEQHLRYDVSRYELAKGTVVNDFVYFMESFLEGEKTSTNGEVFTKRKISHNGDDGYYYILIYDSEDFTIVKHSILILTNKYLYKWSVQGFDGISEVNAAGIFDEKKKLFRIL